MTIRDIYIACFNIDSEDVFNIAVYRGTDLTDYEDTYSFTGYHNIPTNYQTAKVTAFTIGAVHEFCIEI